MQQRPRRLRLRSDRQTGPLTDFGLLCSTSVGESPERHMHLVDVHVFRSASVI